MGRRKKRTANAKLAQQQNTAPSQPSRDVPSASRPARVFSQQQAFSGPLPHPDLLEKYNQVLPGLAERIVALAENQSRHRQDLERKVVFARSRNETLGQIFGAIIALAVVAGSIWLISIGRNVEGLTGLLVQLAALVGIFIYGRRRQEKELSEKRQGVRAKNGRS